MCESGPGWGCGAKLTSHRKRLRSTSAPGRSPLLVLHFIRLSLSLSLYPSEVCSCIPASHFDQEFHLMHFWNSPIQLVDQNSRLHLIFHISKGNLIGQTVCDGKNFGFRMRFLVNVGCGDFFFLSKWHATRGRFWMCQFVCSVLMCNTQILMHGGKNQKLV